MFCPFGTIGGQCQDAPVRTVCWNKGLTQFRRNLSWTHNIFMAENMPNTPSGAVPPKKETGKVQPKKETVRINLPPKPSAAPTIKLPTLPPGGPTGAASPAAAPAAPAPSAPRASAAPMAQRPAAGAAAAPATQRPAPAPARGPAPAPTVSGVDVFLAIAAMIVALAALGSVLYLAFGISIEY